MAHDFKAISQTDSDSASRHFAYFFELPPDVSIEYPAPLRRIRCKDQQGKTLVVITNNLELNAATIKELYSCHS